MPPKLPNCENCSAAALCTTRFCLAGTRVGRDDVGTERRLVDATGMALYQAYYEGRHRETYKIRRVIEAFGLQPTFLPDISGSLDGHVPDDFTPTTHGGVAVAEIATMGQALHTIAIGEQMRGAAEAMQTKAGLRQQPAEARHQAQPQSP